MNGDQGGNWVVIRGPVKGGGGGSSVQVDYNPSTGIRPLNW